MNHRRVFRVLALPFVAVMALLGGAALVSGTATGQVPQPRIVYTVSGTFDDGGTLTGSFIFDPNPACLNRNCPRYSGVNITTSGGDAVYQGTINYTDSDVNAVSGGNFQLNLGLEQQFAVTLGFDSVLGATGAAPLDLQGGSIQWDGVGNTRVLTSGSLVGVEEGPPPTTSTEPAPTDPPVPPQRTGPLGPPVPTVMCHAAADGVLVVVPTTAFEAIADHGHHSGDIIPALTFEDAGRSVHFAGLNLGPIGDDGLTGTQVLAAGCKVSPPTLTAGPGPTTAPPPSPTAAPSSPSPTAAPPEPTDAPPAPTEAPPAPGPTQAPPEPTDAPPAPTEAPPAPGPTQAPPTPTDAPPAPTEAPPAPGPTQAPPTPTATPTLAPAVRCPEGEVEHDGSCVRVPELVVPPTVALQSVTATASGVALTPLADCVDRRENGVMVVWFDYDLAAPDPVTIERGSANALAPTGTPPTLFGPGLHTRVVSVETHDGIASWTLAGQIASSNDQTPDCDRLSATTTAETGAAVTTEAGGAETTAAGGAETTAAGGAGTTGAGADGCDAGERLADGVCEPVEPVRLLFVDNVMECDGHAVARFAAVNDNPFRLDEETFVSTLSPQRLDGDQVTVLERRDEASDDDGLAGEFLTVRYVTSVTWTVTHHGLVTSVSAGVSGATPNPGCPLAAVNATGADGLLATPATMPSTGPDDVLPISLFAALLMLSGMVLIVVAGRRRPADPGLHR